MNRPIVFGGLIFHQLLLDLGCFQLVNGSLLLQLRAFQLDVQHPQFNLVLALRRLEDPHGSLHRFVFVGGDRVVPTYGSGG